MLVIAEDHLKAKKKFHLLANLKSSCFVCNMNMSDLDARCCDLFLCCFHVCEELHFGFKTSVAFRYVLVI